MFQLFGNAIGSVLLISLAVGAGLPAIFALGIRAMATGVDDSGESHPNPAGRVIGVLLFALVIAVILMGLAIIVSSGFGYRVEFDSIIPTFVKK